LPISPPLSVSSPAILIAPSSTSDVRNGSFADVAYSDHDVCFTPESRHAPVTLRCRFVQKQKSARGKSSLHNLATLARAGSKFLAFHSFTAPVIADT
jgi:hypothetical protein